jgi:hypothetical protein
MRVSNLEVKECQICHVPIMKSYGKWIHWGWQGRDENLYCDNSFTTVATPEDEAE